jgi:hypothetical protein
MVKIFSKAIAVEKGMQLHDDVALVQNQELTGRKIKSTCL